MHRILERISRGRATPDDLQTLQELCTLVRETSLCGLGQSAPNPVLSTLRYFLDEYEAHITERRCPAGVCEMGEVSPVPGPLSLVIGSKEHQPATMTKDE
jgi:bidirectional [NiFe] hydrogenase diaphorase subunit